MIIINVYSLGEEERERENMNMHRSRIMATEHHHRLEFGTK